jgi:3-oxoadipate enol-lactonase
MRISVNDITVSYTDEGKNGAPALIFLHSFPFNKSMWNSQVKALEDSYRIIACDIRGHGNSGAGGRDFSIELFVSDLIALMDILKIKKTAVCGLSMGGYIALRAVEDYPERFDALILSDTNCIADTSEVKEKRMTAIDSIRKNGVEKYADESIKNFFAAESFTDRAEEIAAVREMIVETPEQSLVSTLLALSVRKETCSKLAAIKIPVLIMVGKEDKITPPSAAQSMHEIINGSYLHIIEHSGHLSNLENPGEFNALLKKFLAPVYKQTI